MKKMIQSNEDNKHALKTQAKACGYRSKRKCKNVIPKDECGVVALYNIPSASKIAYLALYALQHRGQESAGIVTSHESRLCIKKGMGLVNEVFREESDFQILPGNSAIGHVRYSTSGGTSIENSQPLQIVYRRGSLAVAHNGNIVNALELRKNLERTGAIFHTSVDTEVLLHLLARNVGNFEDALISALSIVKGAFSLVMMSENKIILARDPNGFRPLILGKLGEGWIAASETCAFDLVGAEFIREVEPGEIIFIDESGLRSRFLAPAAHQSLCLFELIYFSRPDSFIFGNSVHEIRVKLGEKLAETHPADADVVISVPDSSNASALGYAKKAGLPFSFGLIRSHYIGRTFIEPDQKIRDFGARIKYNPVASTLKGKRVVLVDDSIVRGTTSKKIVRLIKKAGAKEVHMRIICPPWTHPCRYGIDTPSIDQLIAHNLTVDKMKKEIGVNSLEFLSVQDLFDITGNCSYCTACMDGNYPVEFSDESKIDARREDDE